MHAVFVRFIFVHACIHLCKLINQHIKEINATCSYSYGTGHMKRRTREQTLNKHSCYHQRAHASQSVSAWWQLYCLC